MRILRLMAWMAVGLLAVGWMVQPLSAQGFGRRFSLSELKQMVADSTLLVRARAAERPVAEGRDEAGLAWRVPFEVLDVLQGEFGGDVLQLHVKSPIEELNCSRRAMKDREYVLPLVEYAGGATHFRLTAEVGFEAGSAEAGRLIEIASGTAPAEEVTSLKLRVEPARPPYQVGEPAPVRVVIENPSEQTFTYDQAPLVQRDGALYVAGGGKLEVADSRGNRVTASDALKSGVSPPPPASPVSIGPGEYALEAREDGKPSVLYLWPEDMADAVPAGVGCAKRSHGFSLQGAEHVVVQGFHVRRQGLRRASGIDARGGRDVLVRDCEVSLVKGGTAIGSYRVDGMRVEKCHVHHNPGHTKGIVLRESKNCDVRGCRLVKNTSTGLDYYGCEGGTVADNVVTDHRGMHANGLTFYLGCKDIVIERNRVSRGNVALTFQSAENLLIRNNIFDGNGKTTVVGIWPGQPIRNIRILNNCMVRSNHDVSWQAGLFTNSKKFDGLTVVNNIIDGLCGTPPFPEDAVFSHNLYTRLGPDREDKDFAEGELYEPDAAKVFVDPANGDFRLRPGSPAIDAGAPVERERDVEGTPVPQGGAPDIGPYEYAPGSG